MDIKWENPPAQTRGVGNPDEVEMANALREQPNAWARLFEFDNATKAGALSSQISTGQRAAFRAGFQAKSRTINGKGVVFVRFVGA